MEENMSPSGSMKDMEFFSIGALEAVTFMFFLGNFDCGEADSWSLVMGVGDIASSTLFCLSMMVVDGCIEVSEDTTLDWSLLA
ncbi:hypothetical protein KFK09_023444 [Dendrobium nobile]|uniref:Uncharacterized protein n=1 Tax=Dendrobium nobile TaxID=94219 RepID=A0A8T3AKQ1_DENNO|nr:hypothetical protein KFK09_023444 [Dendrobium nobile]